MTDRFFRGARVKGGTPPPREEPPFMYVPSPGEIMLVAAEVAVKRGMRDRTAFLAVAGVAFDTIIADERDRTG